MLFVGYRILEENSILTKNEYVDTMYVHKGIHKRGIFMTLTKKLTKHGNSYALVIEKAILELLGIDDKTLLQISTPDGITIVITPVKNKSEKKRLSESVKKINKKYGRTLKHLAE